MGLWSLGRRIRRWSNPFRKERTKEEGARPPTHPMPGNHRVREGVPWLFEGSLPVANPRRRCAEGAMQRRMKIGLDVPCRSSPTHPIAAESQIEALRFLSGFVPDPSPSGAKPGTDPSCS